MWRGVLRLPRQVVGNPKSMITLMGLINEKEFQDRLSDSVRALTAPPAMMRGGGGGGGGAPGRWDAIGVHRLSPQPTDQKARNRLVSFNLNQKEKEDEGAKRASTVAAPDAVVVRMGGSGSDGESSEDAGGFRYQLSSFDPSSIKVRIRWATSPPPLSSS
jgi:hypothetical protein